MNRFAEFNNYVNFAGVCTKGRASYNMPFNSEHFPRRCGASARPREAAAIIEEQKAACAVGNPANLVSARLSLVSGRDIFEDGQIKFSSGAHGMTSVLHRGHSL